MPKFSPGDMVEPTTDGARYFPMSRSMFGGKPATVLGTDHAGSVRVRYSDGAEDLWHKTYLQLVVPPDTVRAMSIRVLREYQDGAV